jgi:hypothetical protein
LFEKKKLLDSIDNIRKHKETQDAGMETLHSSSSLHALHQRVQHSSVLSSLGLGSVLLPINGTDHADASVETSNRKQSSSSSSSSCTLITTSSTPTPFTHNSPIHNLHQTALTNFNHQKSTRPIGLKGGAESPSSPAIPGIAGLSRQAIEEYVMNHVRSSPLTSIQIVTGFTLFTANLIGLVPARPLLFHTRLALAPRWEVHRMGTAFLIMGTNIVDIVRSIAGLLYWQAPLERYISGSGDVVQDGRLVHRGDNRRGGTMGKRKSMVEWLVTQNRFLRMQALAAVTMVGLEVILYRDPPPLNPLMGGGILVFPYSLFPLLEHTMRWIWALTDLHGEIKLLGMIPLQPVYAPLVVSAMSGFATWKYTFKGLLGAIVVARAMGLRRGGEGGEYVHEYMYHLGMRWYRWFSAIVGQNKGPTSGAPSVAPTTPGSYPSSSSSSTGGYQNTRPSAPTTPAVPIDPNQLMSQFAPYLNTAAATFFNAFNAAGAGAGATAPSSGSAPHRGPIIQEIQMDDVPQQPSPYNVGSGRNY